MSGGGEASWIARGADQQRLMHGPPGAQPGSHADCGATSKTDGLREINALLNAGRLAESRLRITQLLQRYPKDPAVLRQAAFIAFRGGSLSDARRYLGAAIAVAPSCELHNGMGNLLMALGCQQDALLSYRQALSLAPNDFDASNNLGVALYRSGQLDEAGQIFRTLLRSHPDRCEVHNNLGGVLQRLGHLKEALACFQRSVQLTPDYVEGLFNMGVVHDRLRQFDRARSAFSSVIERRPGHVDAHHRLGLAHRKQGHYDAAIAAIARALEGRPDNPVFHASLAEAQRRAGHLDEAVASSRAALDLAMFGTSAAPSEASPLPYSVEKGRQVLLLARDILGAADVPFFLCLGTLLGIVRQGELLPFDKDMDLGMPWDVDRRALIDVMTADGDFVFWRELAPHEEDWQWYMPFLHVETGCSLDVYFFKPDGEHFLCGFNQRPTPMLSRPQRFGVKSMAWAGADWPVPDDCPRYLADVYGPDWRVPAPLFETLLSSHCKVDASLEQRHCFGHLKLYERIRQQQWRKAAACCSQLRAIRDDEFLQGVQAWLAEKSDA